MSVRATLFIVLAVCLWTAAAAETRVRTRPVAPSPVPEILYDVSVLPEPVQRMRERILEAARSGDLEKLRPVIESNELPPSFTLETTSEKDPIAILRQGLDEPNGYELLAILVEVLEAGFVHADEGTPQEMYVWPYFAQYPLDKLTPEQKVELFRIVTSYDYKQMEADGAYAFYRVGIGPDGTWHFFVTGH